MKKKDAETRVKEVARAWSRNNPEDSKDPFFGQERFYVYLKENCPHLLDFRTRGPINQIIGLWFKEANKPRP
ncbi:MAG: hypothetical protein OXE44_01815 [Nitrospinae bacterium]|nr:hypothetical protein [Nitrospinota bacterium]